MSMLTTTCPHCAAQEIALKVIGFDATRRDGVVNAFTTCPRCFSPSCHEIWRGPYASTTQEWFATSAAREAAVEVTGKSG